VVLVTQPNPTPTDPIKVSYVLPLEGTIGGCYIIKS
jgi:hypothetical protein